jgi:hypothetical protein
MPAPPSPPLYQSLRYDEDWSYLKDPARRSDPWDALKYIALGRENWYLSFGGEGRLRYEGFRNSGFGRGPQDPNGYLLQRYLFHTDAHVGKNVRFFVQFQSGLESGRNGGPRPTDEDKLEFHQAFVDFQHSPDATHSLTLRVGRQEFEFGSGRMISASELLNVRVSFDGVRMSARSGPWVFHAIAARPVETNPGFFDDSPDHQRWVWGAGAVRPNPLLRGGSLSLYYIGLDRKEGRFDSGLGHEARHTLGSRIFGNTKRWDYNDEFIYQWGTFGRDDIRAWAASTEIGYVFPRILFAPRAGMRADFSSGGHDALKNTLHTFNPLFPGTAYSGKIGLLGPSNIIDINPVIRLKLHKRVTFTGEWGLFWREDVNDGLYGILVNVIKTGSRSRARYIANQPDFQLSWLMSRHLTMVAILTEFRTGRFIKETPPDRNIGYATVYFTYRF